MFVSWANIGTSATYKRSLNLFQLNLSRLVPDSI